jgi:REP element-mobilizing transposase RayT
LITGELRDRLARYISGILRKYGVKTVCIGGTSDHLHLLASLPATISVSKTAQVAKGSSSKWVHETFPDKRDFSWQEGYGAFSVSVSHVQEAVAYITSQAERHHKKTFQEEYIAFLRKHNVEYDERYLWG